MNGNEMLAAFAAAHRPAQAEVVQYVRAFVEWQAEREGGNFEPDGAADDVALRTYLAHLRTGGAARPALRRQTAALRRFYDWAAGAGLIAESPFDSFNFDRPILSRQEIRRRRATFTGDARERELGYLRALNSLAGRLNRAPDTQSALNAALAAMVEQLHLKTAWAFVLADSGLMIGAAAPPHDFALAAACKLPSGLEQDDRRYLCHPPDCHCQFVLREGRMTRAVNVVECTRLQDAAEAQGDNEGLLFHASVPLMLAGRPAGIMNFATEEWQFLSAADLQLLTAAGGLVSSALERARLYELVRAAQARLELELRTARDVQASLLPNPLPRVPGCELAADWLAAREVAGDFYDVFAIGDGGEWVFVVGDVSDKGAPAALYMAMARSLLRAQAEGAAGPGALLHSVNRALCDQSTAGMFVTLFCAFFDAASGRLRYANAGHNPPLLRLAGGELAELRPTGPLLGVFDSPRIGEAEARLAAGDALVCYTDGLTEAENAEGQQFGAAGLARAVAAGPQEAAALLRHVLDEATKFHGDAPQADDVTLLVLRRTPGPGGPAA